MKILVVEDDQQTAKFIIKGLKQEGHLVNHAVNGEEGLYFIETEIYDLAIIDIMMPKIDGFNLVKILRERNNLLPVIILSAKNSVDDRIRGLQAGSDDYMSKPFSFPELMARIQTIMRRSSSDFDMTSFTIADLTLDVIRRKIYRNNIEISLASGEFTLLEYLMRNAGRVISKTMIIDHIWGYNFDPGTNVVETRISRLREKIDKPFGKTLLHTVRGFGYVIEDKE